MRRNKAIESVKAFLPNDREIELAIRLCDLYPCEGSWKKWGDNQGSYIQIQGTKKLVSFTHNPLDQDERIITDLYFKSHPQKIASISKWAFIAFGRDNNDLFNVCFIWFLGKDNRLRMATLKRDKWIKNSSPLICGIDTLKSVIRTICLDGRREDISDIKGPIAAYIVCSWSTQWPPSQDILEEMTNKNENLTNRIKELC